MTIDGNDIGVLSVRGEVLKEFRAGCGGEFLQEVLHHCSCSPEYRDEVTTYKNFGYRTEFRTLLLLRPDNACLGVG